MFRLFVFAVLLTLGIIEYIRPMKKFVFPITSAALTLMLALRCGQGTDYFSYCRIYLHPDADEFKLEEGFKWAIKLFHSAELPYTVFTFAFSVIIMIVLYVIIVKACNNRFMGLFAIYSLYYMQFFENGIRQALAMMIVLLGLVLSVKKERVWFLLLAPCLALVFHTSAVVSFLMLIPYISVKWKKLDNSVRNHYIIWTGLFVIAAAGMLFISSWQPLWDALTLLPESLYIRLEHYIRTTSFSVMSLVSRGVFLAVVSVLYIGSRNRRTTSERALFRCYLLGFIVYCALFRFDIIASRMNAYYKIIEIILIPNLIGHFSLSNFRKPQFVDKFIEKKPAFLKAGKVCAVLVPVALLTFMYLKTTKDVMGQSKYYNPGYIYPYYTVFNVEDLYWDREPPGFVFKEYYAFTETENPREIGYSDEFGYNYFTGVSYPQTVSNFRPELEEAKYSLCPEPLSKEGCLDNLLETASSDNVYGNKDYVEISEKKPYDEEHYRRIKDWLEDRK